MPIDIQVVGIFFSATLPLDGDQKVIDVLKAASQQAGSDNIPNVSSFTFEVSSPPKVAMLSFTVNYKGPFKGRAIGLDYPPGEYFLAENTQAKPSYPVWQYYVLKADKTPVTGGVKFLDNPEAIVPAGGTLIWRLVSILTGPNSPPRMVAARQTMPAAF